jgi:hypothetical protein
VAIGDFNEDGIADLVTANRTFEPTVAVLLGNGDGTFVAPQMIPVPDFPNSVAVGDFNEDGHSDLVVANTGLDSNPNHTVSILFGNGDGTFRAGPTMNVGVGPYSVAVGHLTGDGHEDVAVANKFSNSVSVLLGNGDGTFKPAQNFAVGTGPESIAIGDFRGDGHADLVTANWGVSNDLSVRTVSVLLGNGDGTFQPARDYLSGIHPISVVVGDFNHDGHEDLAVANEVGPAADTATVAILLGRGDGTFGPPQTYVAGDALFAIGVGDFNGDGYSDLAVADWSHDVARILLGNGDGTFQVGQPLEVGPGPAAVAVGDFNGDRHQDLVTGNGGGNTVSVLLGDGQGTFLTAPDLEPGRQPWAVAVGDFNGDGQQDLAVTYTAPSTTVSVLLGNGDGTFQAAQDYSVGDGAAPFALTVGDFNNDGIPDLATANRGTNPSISVFLGNGDGTFKPAQNTPLPPNSFTQNLTAGDFDRDGVLDLAVTNPLRNSVSILRGNGDGTFQAPQEISVANSPFALAVDDFNGDGIADLAVTSFGSCCPFHPVVSILLGNGDGSFQQPQEYPVGGAPTSLVVGDFLADGHRDLAVGNDDGISVLLSNGDGTFQAAHTIVVGAIPKAMAIGDFNGDTTPDLAVATDENNVAVFHGNGDGTFGLPQLFGVASEPWSIAVGDFNGDGQSDLVTANLLGRSLSILINDTVSP